jgi:hypothetical protein
MTWTTTPPPVITPQPQLLPPRRRWGRVATASALGLSALAATAAITYAVTVQSSTTAPAPRTITPQPPTYTAAQQAAAKDRVCNIFDVSTRGADHQGGVRANGLVNVPVVLRTLDSVVAIQAALVPATPADVATAARRYVSTELDLITAAMGTTPADEGDRLNDVANTAVVGMETACGLGH